MMSYPSQHDAHIAEQPSVHIKNPAPQQLFVPFKSALAARPKLWLRAPANRITSARRRDFRWLKTSLAVIIDIKLTTVVHITIIVICSRQTTRGRAQNQKVLNEKIFKFLNLIEPVPIIMTLLRFTRNIQ